MNTATTITLEILKGFIGLLSKGGYVLAVIMVGLWCLILNIKQKDLCISSQIK
jgi:hypothetical protein